MINSTQMLTFSKLSQNIKTEAKATPKTEEKNQQSEVCSTEWSVSMRSLALAGISLNTPSRTSNENQKNIEIPLEEPSSEEMSQNDENADHISEEDANRKLDLDEFNIVDYDAEITLALDDIKYLTQKSLTGEEVNEWWLTEMDYDNPPYLPKSKVQQIELQEETKFVRVYDGENSGMYGGWVMKSSDIEGLTPEEIQDKFALPQKPIKTCDVILPKGTQMRVGFCNPLEGWGKGGGLQFDLMGQKVGEFCNERDLPT